MSLLRPLLEALEASGGRYVVVPVRVAGLVDLVALKRLAGRDRDLDDLAALGRIAEARRAR